MQHRPLRTHGFTLVEVLVALLIMAVIAAMSWQGIDAIVRSRDISAGRLEQQLRLQSVIAQWETDLAELQDPEVVPALQFDGANLRLTRRTPEGLQMVVWALRGESLMRWAGPSVTHVRALQQSWLQAQQLLGNETGQLRALGGVASWQLYYWRGNSWSNAQSSAGVVAPVSGAASGAAPSQSQLLPQGVRMVLAFREGGGFAGSLQRDVQLGPNP